METCLLGLMWFLVVLDLVIRVCWYNIPSWANLGFTCVCMSGFDCMIQ